VPTAIFMSWVSVGITTNAVPEGEVGPNSQHDVPTAANVLWVAINTTWRRRNGGTARSTYQAPVPMAGIVPKVAVGVWPTMSMASSVAGRWGPLCRRPWHLAVGEIPVSRSDCTCVQFIQFSSFVWWKLSESENYMRHAPKIFAPWSLHKAWVLWPHQSLRCNTSNLSA
jgi:hypothetical protein